MEALLPHQIMTNSKRTQNPAARSSDPYYGDLRKGAYLKRREAYQMQAGSSTPAQAGTLTARGKDRA